MNNWDKKYIDLAKHIATWSKDNSTKVGAVIVSEENRIISTGYNGMPIGANDSIESRYEKKMKYYFFEHAERNAIYSCANSGVSTKNATIYVQYYPCADCARAIIQSGIKRLVCCSKPDFNHPKWGESWKVADELFNECHVNVEHINI